MKKILFLTIFTFIISIPNVKASSVSYNLKIDRNAMFHESITYNIDNKKKTPYLNSIINNPVYFDIDKQHIYTKKVMSNKTNTMVILSYDYEASMSNSSALIKKCFEDFDILIEDKEHISFSADNFKCRGIVDSVSIKIEPELYVSNSTVGSISENSNTYVWDPINDDVNVSMILGEEDNTPLYSEEPYDSSIIIYLVVSITITISVIGLIIILVLKKRKPKTKDEEFYNF